MNSTITVRDINPGDKAWLQREARQAGVSMEEFVRRLIREKRVNSERRAKPSEVFERHFGPRARRRAAALRALPLPAGVVRPRG